MSQQAAVSAALKNPNHTAPAVTAKRQQECKSKSWKNRRGGRRGRSFRPCPSPLTEESVPSLRRRRASGSSLRSRRSGSCVASRTGSAARDTVRHDKRRRRAAARRRPGFQRARTTLDTYPISDTYHFPALATPARRCHEISDAKGRARREVGCVSSQP
eukprot:6185586-Pleurochrysis_carterae.AAC.1